VLNLAIAHLLLVGTGGLLDELLDFIEPRNTVIGYALRAIPALQPRDLRSSGFVIDTLQTALWVALYTDEFEEGLVMLANLGGDADTLAAVGGALLGARFGAQAIPQRWLEQLEQCERIEKGAQALYQLSQE
jgi:ADP-ribosyl-[dinitrogen reductase] hydrolase